jgi:hypothetical protein
MTQMPGIAMEQKSAGQSASKIFMRRGFMVRYVRTPNAGNQRLATKGLSTPPDFIASPLHRVVRSGLTAARTRVEVSQCVSGIRLAVAFPSRQLARDPRFVRSAIRRDRAAGDRLRRPCQRRGLRTTAASGGSDSDRHWSRPWCGSDSVCSAPALPTLPPPYHAESLLKTSS